MTHRARLTPPRIAILAFAAFILVACQGAPQATAPQSTAPGNATAASPSPDEPTGSPTAGIAEKVDIGGRSLFLECRGTGSPTILFLHGADGGDRTHGHHLMTAYADRHTVCLYDRAGIGLSDPADEIQSGVDVIDDLERLLDAAEVPGPYLLVANSFGGVLAEIFAAEQPDSIAGMVLVDASLHTDADVDRWFAEQGELDLEQFQAEYESRTDAIRWTIHDEARASLDRIPDVPITYLRALQTEALPADAQEIWNAGLDELLARSSNGQVVEVDGPHTLPPPPIHAAIDEMLASATDN